MANIHRSEVPLSLGGTTYTLKLSNNSICAIEQAAGKNFFEIVSALFKGNVWASGAFLYGGLLSHHPGISYEDAMDMVPIDDPVPFMKTIITAVNAAFPPSISQPESKDSETVVTENPS